MSLNCGIVGLPNVGKSTLFNALTAAKVPSSNFPFCTIEPNVGMVPVPDRRLQALAKVFSPEKVVPTTVEFVDIAGLVKGASQGEGLGNQFLSHVREVDALIHLVRCFEDPEVVHVDGTVDSLRDIETIQTELCLADLETVGKAMAKARQVAKSGRREDADGVKNLESLHSHLNRGKPLSTFHEDNFDPTLIPNLHPLTVKPVLYVCNVAEEMVGKHDNAVEKVRALVASQGGKVVEFSAKLEAELEELAPEERQTFLADLGWAEPGLHRVITASYELLKLVTFFTVRSKECRAWTIPQGTHAPQAAGKIHTDFERGFIKADIFHFQDLEQYGTETELRTHGLIRTEGKEYIVQDGDICHFKFNV